MNRRRNGKQPPAPRKKIKPLFFFDVDGTLISASCAAGNRLKSRIAQLQKLGFIFGLNTNRPWSEAKDVYAYCGLNGPIICEGGSYYKLSPRKKIQPLPRADSRLRQKVTLLLKKNEIKFGCRVAVGSDKKILASRSGGRLIFINNTRRFSCSIYIRRSGRPDKKIAWKICRRLKKELANHSVNLLPDRAKITIDNPLVSKISALNFVLQRHFKGGSAFFISDCEVISGRWPKIRFCAIMKAKPSYKKHCQYVAKKTGQAGLLEIINNNL